MFNFKKTTGFNVETQEEPSYSLNDIDNASSNHSLHNIIASNSGNINNEPPLNNGVFSQ